MTHIQRFGGALNAHPHFHSVIPDGPFVPSAEGDRLEFVVRVSIGGTIATPGVWGIPDDAPRPIDVSVESGVVHSSLLYSEGRTQWALMLLQMVAPDSDPGQVFPGADVTTAELNAEAQIYVR